MTCVSTSLFVTCLSPGSYKQETPLCTVDATATNTSIPIDQVQSSVRMACSLFSHVGCLELRESKTEERKAGVKLTVTTSASFPMNNASALEMLYAVIKESTRAYELYCTTCPIARSIQELPAFDSDAMKHAAVASQKQSLPETIGAVISLLVTTCVNDKTKKPLRLRFKERLDPKQTGSILSVFCAWLNSPTTIAKRDQRTYPISRLLFIDCPDDAYLCEVRFVCFEHAFCLRYDSISTMDAYALTVDRGFAPIGSGYKVHPAYQQRFREWIAASKTDTSIFPSTHLVYKIPSSSSS